jgi:asparagine synthetase B (glutamine-hydrolysing)
MPGYDERAEALRTARAVGAEVVLVEVGEDDFRDALPAAVAAMEAPIYNAHPVAKLLLARAMRRDGVTLALSGDGADHVVKRDRTADYLPLARDLFRAAGVTLRSPFLDGAVVGHLVSLPPDPEKPALRAVGAALGVARELVAGPKQGRLAPPIRRDGTRRARLARPARRARGPPPPAARRRAGLDALDHRRDAPRRRRGRRLMCGIGGIVRYDAPVDGEALAAMLARLRHRGPDGEGTFVAPHVGLVHTRLALLDAAGGAQPMRSRDGRYTLVYNGEVYGLDALRRALAPSWDFATRSDAEVVLAAYAAWGERCVERLEGMFALFVWDAARGEGFAARDRLGVKPLVYAWDGARFAFASEAKALLPALPSPPRAHTEALLEVLAAPCFSGVESPAFAGMENLPPGSRLRVSRAGLAVERWWRYALTGDATEDDATLAAGVGDALARAVAADARGGRAGGGVLSGGLDSTALAAYARRAGAAPRGPSRFASTTTRGPTPGRRASWCPTTSPSPARPPARWPWRPRRWRCRATRSTPTSTRWPTPTTRSPRGSRRWRRAASPARPPGA